MGFRKCFVPSCTNTSVTTPDKSFICVPKDEHTRARWYQIIGKRASRTGFIHCCEDHFDIPNDSLNYIRHKYMGGPIKLKPGIVPHKNLLIKICRICLTKLTDESCYLTDATEESQHLFETYLPEIDFSLTTDPAFCNKCFKKIEAFHNMKMSVLSQEVLLVSYMKQEIESLKENDKLKGDLKINLHICYKEIKDACNEPKQAKKRRKHLSGNQKGNEEIQTGIITHSSGEKEDSEADKYKIDEENQMNQEDIIIVSDPSSRTTHDVNNHKDQNSFQQLHEDKSTNESNYISDDLPRPLDASRDWFSDKKCSTNNMEGSFSEIVKEQQQITQLQPMFSTEELVNSNILNVTNSESLIHSSLTDKKIMYNNEICQVVYLNEDGLGSYTTVNVIQLFDHNNQEESTCLFCNGYFGDDILNHSFTHSGSTIKCSLCDFASEVATEAIITEHIYVHSVVSNEINESQK